MAGRSPISSPQPGVRDINGVYGRGKNVNFISSDGSLAIVPNPTDRTIDLSVLGASGLVVEGVACDSEVYVGAFVRMDAVGIAFNALADSVANSNVIGVCTGKDSPTVCTVRVTGVTGAIFTSLDPTKDYYLSATVAGGICTTVPTGSGQVVLKIGQPFSEDRLLVNKGERYVKA